MSTQEEDTQGMGYLDTSAKRWVTIYAPLGIFVFVLLFPFYWMVITSFKPNKELLSREGNPFWVIEPTLDHFKKLLFDTAYPEWLWNTVLVSVVATFVSLACSVLAAYAIERLRFSGSKQTGLAIFLAYLVPPSILFIPLATIVFKLGLFDTRWALILTYPTFLIPFCTWLLMGYFRSIPFELEECALIDGATRFEILVKIILPLSFPALASFAIFQFLWTWNDLLVALVFLGTGNDQQVLTGNLVNLMGSRGGDWEILSASAFVSIAVPLVVFFAMQKYLVRGLLAGSVK